MRVRKCSPARALELRLLCSARLDSHLLLTVVLAGDQRLLERFRADELLPLGSRMRVRLSLERSTPQELQQCLQHALQKAGAPKLMTPELIATLCDHAQGNLRAMMNMAGELLALAAQREAHQIDEQLFFEAFATPLRRSPRLPRDGGGENHHHEHALPVELAYRLADRAESNVGSSPVCGPKKPSASSAASRSVASPSSPWIWPSPWPPAPVSATLPRAAPGACCSTPPRTHCTSCAAGSKASVPPQTCEPAGTGCSRHHRPTVRLDLPADRARLEQTVEQLKPRLLVLDPFVRLHRIDENASGEVAPLACLLARTAATA
jgi:hypothetical protein